LGLEAHNSRKALWLDIHEDSFDKSPI